MDPLFSFFSKEFENMNLSDLDIICAIINAKAKSDDESQIKSIVRDELNREVISYIRKTNDIKVRNNFILKYSYVYKIILNRNAYMKETVHKIEEYESVTFEAILSTIYNYNLSSRTKYITYLYSSVWGMLYRDYSKNQRLINYPYEYIGNLVKINKVINDYIVLNGKNPSYKYISDETDLSVKQVKEILSHDYTEESLNKVSNENEEFYYELKDPNGTNFIDDVLNKDSLNKLLNYIKKILPPSQYEILALFLGLECNPKSRSQIAKENNVTVSAVSLRLRKAIQKLKNDDGVVKYLSNEPIDITDLTVSFYDLFPYEKKLVNSLFANLDEKDQKYIRECFGSKLQLLKKYSTLDKKVLFIINKMKKQLLMIGDNEIINNYYKQVSKNSIFLYLIKYLPVEEALLLTVFLVGYNGQAFNLKDLGNLFSIDEVKVNLYLMDLKGLFEIESNDENEIKKQVKEKCKKLS